mgnify:CR=1 FL=1
MPHVPASGGGAPTPLDSGHRPVPPIQAGLAGKTQALRLAYQGSAGNAYRMDFSPREQLPVRLCNKVPSRQQGTAGLHQDVWVQCSPSDGKLASICTRGSQALNGSGFVKKSREKPTILSSFKTCHASRPHYSTCKGLPHISRRQRNTGHRCSERARRVHV